MAKTLVVYYTHSQNTAKLANIIAQEVKGDCVALIPEEEYPRDYNTVVQQAKKEISKNYHPALKNHVDIREYDTIFVGSPNWWSTVAPPVATFLVNNDFSGKTVIPFCTHGGGGFGHIEKDVKNLCSNAKTLQGIAIYGSSANKSEVAKWLKRIQ